MEPGDLRFYRARIEDLPQLVDLMNTGPGPHFYNLELARWKYCQNPAGEGRLYFAGYRDTGVCAAYNVMAWNMVIRGKYIKCAQSVDTFVHPDFRGRGLFRKLFQFAADQLASEQVPFIVGFPNQTAFGNFIKMGWVNPTGLRTLALVMDIRRFLKDNGSKTRQMAIRIGNSLLSRRNGKRFLNGTWEVSSVRSFNELPLQSGDSAVVETLRDPSYMEWRYIERPKSTYEILKVTPNEGPPSYFVVNKTTSMADIVDIAPCEDTAQMELAFSAVCLHLGEQGFYGVRCGSSGKLTHVLRKIGFVTRGDYAPLIVYPLRVDTEVLEAAADRWLLRTGDIEAA